MDDVLTNLFNVYGPFAVFLLLMLSGIGLSVTEDLIIIPAGILIGHGTFDLVPTVLWAYAGVIASDMLWFTICWRYGTPLLHKRWFKRVVHPRRLLEAKHQIEKRGAWVIVTARFVPGSRTTAITAAGVLHMQPLLFFRADGLASLVTVPLQLSLGYLIAQGVGTEQSADLVLSMIGVFVAVIVIMIVLALWRRMRSRRERPPRARAAWLRRFRQRFHRA